MSDKDNVTNIKSSRKKLSLDSIDKYPPVEFYKCVRDAINGEHETAWIKMPEFLERFYVFEHEKGIKSVLHDFGDGQVRYVHKDYVADKIAYYCDWMLLGKPGFQWDYAACRRARDYWQATTAPILDTPRWVAWKSQAGLCFRRLPWDFSSDYKDKTPLFDEILSRVKYNRDALIEWIGSIFVNQSDVQQYLWIYGEGGNGKSSLARLLNQIVGSSCKSMRAPGKNTSDHWTEALEGIRLMIFPDCNNQDFVRTDIFKALTGNDDIYINPKNQSGYTISPKIKYLFFSNRLPNISTEEADLRRAIYCEIGPRSGSVDPDYQKKLWDESRFIVSRCIDFYMRKHKATGFGPIDTNREVLLEIADEFEEPFQNIFDQYFEHEEGEHVAPVKIADILKNDRRLTGNIRMGEFKRWMRRKYNIYKTVDHTAQKPCKVYKNIRVKTYTESMLF